MLDAPSETALDANRRRWVRAKRRDAAVLAWLDKNPPPRDWIESKIAWAYFKMPKAE